MLKHFLLISSLVTVFFYQSNGEICENQAALTSIKAFVHQQKNSRGQHFNGSFYDLEQDFVYVEVTDANVTHLCEGMVKNFYRIELLSLINVNLSKIDPGAFQNVPSLKQLSLAVNHLKNIENGVFNTIRSLQIIYLSNNEIETIAHGAFSEMPFLKALHLNHNKLAQLSGNILFGSRKIDFVDFSFNQITEIEEKSFDDLQPEDVTRLINVYLKKNEIKSVNANALEKMKNPIRLHLEGNLLQTISSIVFAVKERSEVYLNNNQIECIADDALDEVISKSKIVYVKDSPIECKCLFRIDKYLQYEEIKGKIVYQSKFPCKAFASYM